MQWKFLSAAGHAKRHAGLIPASADLAPQRLHPAHVSLPAHQPFAWVSHLHESTLILIMHATL